MIIGIFLSISGPADPLNAEHFMCCSTFFDSQQEERHTNAAATDTYGSSASTAWSNSNKTATITLGSGEAVENGTALTISSVQDAAGNESDITFTLDIA